MTLSFTFAGIPIRIQPWFFLMAVFLGTGHGAKPAAVAEWTVVVFLSVMLHELGHALVGKAFGLAPQIELHGMGGTTSWQATKAIGNGKRILISLAGPMAGIALGVALVFLPFKPAHPLMQMARSDLISVNIGWGIFNLIPMLPLDGGSVMASTLNAITGGRGMKPARIISIVVAGGILMLALARQYTVIAFLAGLFAFQNIQGLRRDDVVDSDGPLAERMRRGVEALRREEGETVILEVEPVAATAKTPELRAEAHRLLAYGYMLAQRWSQLVSLLRGEGGLYLSVGDLEEMEGRATALALHEVARQIAEVRRRREMGPVGAEFRA